MANPQEPLEFFWLCEADESIQTIEDDLLLFSEENQTDHDVSSNTENEKQKDPSNWPLKSECSLKEQQIETKTFSSLSDTETGKSVYEDIGCKQSTSSHNCCEKNVECLILETCSSLSKPSMSSVATTTEYVTCISSTYKIITESNISRQPLNKSRTINKIRFPDGDLLTDAKKCDIRREKFVNRERLTKHVRTPNDEKPQCPVCSKVFKEKKYLNLHMRIHTGQRTHRCTICNKTFAQKGHLTTHMSTHTDLKPHQCEECNNKFAQKSHLTRHMSTHTGLKNRQCEVCGKKFAHKGTLTRHIFSHTGQKPHPCTECDKSFSEKSNLKRHMKTHTNEKPYKCPECDKTCRTRGNLNSHRKTHTK